MEAATTLRFSPISLKFSDFGSKSCVFAKFNLSNGFLKGNCEISLSRQGRTRSSFATLKRSSGIRASSTSSSNNLDSSSWVAPLQLESPVGQFLSQILHSHPHLLPAAVDQQLKQLQMDQETQKQQPDPPSSGTDLVLYNRRIAEVKANDRKRALEEILYALVVQKFVEAGVSLVPTLSSSNPSGRVDQWPTDEGKLEGLHSSEAYEMIKNHLSLILGQRLDDGSSIAPVSKLRVGQVYAASIMYGYFLKRVDQRFQLEKSMKTLPWGAEEEGTSIKQSMPDESRPFTGNSRPRPEVSSWSSSSPASGASGDKIKPCRLRTYVMSFDPETLQRYATVRSKEAFSIIEKHTEALFGRPEIVITPQGAIDSSKDEVIKISFGGLKRLIIEAATFGSFLWDVESYVDSRYHFVAN